MNNIKKAFKTKQALSMRGNCFANGGAVNANGEPSFDPFSHMDPFVHMDSPVVPRQPDVAVDPAGANLRLFSGGPDAFKPLSEFAQGGAVKGPGGPRSDSIPIRASDGEYVLPADTVRAVGVRQLDALRAATHTPTANGMRDGCHYANGGVVGDPTLPTPAPLAPPAAPPAAPSPVTPAPAAAPTAPPAGTAPLKTPNALVPVPGTGFDYSRPPPNWQFYKAPPPPPPTVPLDPYTAGRAAGTAVRNAGVRAPSAGAAAGTVLGGVAAYGPHWDAYGGNSPLTTGQKAKLFLNDTSKLVGGVLGGVAGGGVGSLAGPVGTVAGAGVGGVLGATAVDRAAGDIRRGLNWVNEKLGGSPNYITSTDEDLQKAGFDPNRNLGDMLTGKDPRDTRGRVTLSQGAAARVGNGELAKVDNSDFTGKKPIPAPAKAPVGLASGAPGVQPLPEPDDPNAERNRQLAALNAEDPNGIVRQTLDTTPDGRSVPMYIFGDGRTVSDIQPRKGDADLLSNVDVTDAGGSGKVGEPFELNGKQYRNYAYGTSPSGQPVIKGVSIGGRNDFGNVDDVLRNYGEAKTRAASGMSDDDKAAVQRFQDRLTRRGQIEEQLPELFPSTSNAQQGGGRPDGYVPFASVTDPTARRNLQIFADAVANGEGADYDTIVGGKQKITDFSRHPGIVGLTTKDGPSTAAGRYQITGTTAKGLGMTDFSPASQDRAFMSLVSQKDALGDVIAGNFDKAAAKLGNVWQSLPSGTSPNQPHRTAAQFQQQLAAAQARAGAGTAAAPAVPAPAAYGLRDRNHLAPQASWTNEPNIAEDGLNRDGTVQIIQGGLRNGRDMMASYENRANAPLDWDKADARMLAMNPVYQTQAQIAGAQATRELAINDRLRQEREFAAKYGLDLAQFNAQNGLRQQANVRDENNALLKDLQARNTSLVNGKNVVDDAAVTRQNQAFRRGMATMGPALGKPDLQYGDLEDSAREKLHLATELYDKVNSDADYLNPFTPRFLSDGDPTSLFGMKLLPNGDGQLRNGETIPARYLNKVGHDRFGGTPNGKRYAPLFAQ